MGLDFLEGQETLTSIEWILRAFVGFIFLLLAARLTGQRFISQLRFLDFVLALAFGNIIAHPLSDEHLGLKGPMITTLVLIISYVTLTQISLKWPLVRSFLEPRPLELIRDGVIQFHNLARARLSVELLFSELRKEKVEDIKKVACALWEPGGEISLFLDPRYQPPTAEAMNIATQPFTLIRPVILEGKIDQVLLMEMGKEEAWLRNKILSTHPDISSIKMATIDENGEVTVH